MTRDRDRHVADTHQVTRIARWLEVNADWPFEAMVWGNESWVRQTPWMVTWVHNGQRIRRYVVERGGVWKTGLRVQLQRSHKDVLSLIMKINGETTLYVDGQAWRLKTHADAGDEWLNWWDTRVDNVCSREACESLADQHAAELARLEAEAARGR